MTQTKERKRFKNLNLLDRFLFAEAMEDQQNMELLLDIILNQETHLKQPTQTEKEQAPAKKKVVRAYNRQVVFQAKTLQTDADIDDYVEKIRSQLKQLLKNCDEIKLN